MAADSKVREAATALMIAIGEARAAGYVVQWPRRAEDLPRIAVSATGAVRPVAKTGKATGKKRVGNAAVVGAPADAALNGDGTGEPLPDADLVGNDAAPETE